MAVAMSETEYWVMEEADTDDKMPEFILVTSEFAHTVSAYNSAPSFHLRLPLPPPPLCLLKFLPVLSSSPQGSCLS